MEPVGAELLAGGDRSDVGLAGTFAHTYCAKIKLGRSFDGVTIRSARLMLTVLEMRDVFSVSAERFSLAVRDG